MEKPGGRNCLIIRSGFFNNFLRITCLTAPIIDVPVFVSELTDNNYDERNLFSDFTKYAKVQLSRNSGL